MGEGKTLREEAPHVYQVGRYAFYMVCAFSVGTMAAVIVKALHGQDMVQRLASSLVAFVVFCALRDMMKNDMRFATTRPAASAGVDSA